MANALRSACCPENNNRPTSKGLARRARPPEAAGKSLRTLVDATLPLNELSKRFRSRFVLCRIPEHARPLGPRSLVYFLMISGAQDDRGERLVSSWQIHTLKPQRPACSADRAILCRPPHHEVEHRREVAIDCVAIPTGLALIPSIAHPQEVLPQCLRGVRYFVPNGLSESRRSQPKIRVHSFEVCHCSNPE
jgi:hypothetical protein